jgi:hypothetical protein
MNVIGTGVAAGVAQTSLQAQQTARERDRKKVQEAEASKRTREVFEAHLHALEGPEKIEAIDSMQIEGHVPQDQTDGHRVGPDEQDDLTTDAAIATDAATFTAATPPEAAAPPDQPGTPPDTEGPLYHHLDVQG